MCYHSFLAGSGSSLPGGDGLGGNPAGANSDQPPPESQAYSEELDPVETQQKLTRISHYSDHRFKFTRKYMIRSEPRNDDPKGVIRSTKIRFTRSPVQFGLEISRRFQKLRQDARREVMMLARPKNGSRWCPKRSSGLTRRKPT